MTLQQLEYLVALDKHRQFAQAAEHCGVTQPTLSVMIKKLEEELGVTLVNRSRQPLSLTPIGSLVVSQAEEVLSGVQKIPALIRQRRQSLRGEFRLGMLPTIAPYLLPRFFQHFISHYPEVHLQVIEMQTARMSEAFDKREIDAGIAAGGLDSELLEEKMLFYERYFVYVSGRERLFHHDIIRTSDITGERLWLLDEGHCFRDQFERFCTKEKVLLNRSSCRLGSIDTLMRIVEHGRGMTFVPELALEQLSAEQRSLVRPFAIPVPTRKVCIYHRTDFVRLQLLEAIVQQVQSTLPPQMLSLQSTQKVL